MSSAKGREAEDRAANYLLSLGYTLITRRFKTRHGEIDIVALDGDTLVFVEVKYRSSDFVTPEESVTRIKAERFESAVSDYFSKTGQPEIPARYDLIAIRGDRIEHHQSFV